MRKYIQRGLIRLLLAGLVAAGLNTGCMRPVSRQLRTPPSPLEERVKPVKRPVSLTFLLGSHGSPKDVKQIVDELDEKKYTDFYMEGSMQRETASRLNEYLEDFVGDYRINHDENIPSCSDEDYKKRLLNVFSNTFSKYSFMDELVELTIQCAKRDFVLRFFEGYTESEIEELERLSSKHILNVYNFIKEKDKEAYVEKSIDSLVNYIACKNRLMPRKINELEERFGEHNKHTGSNYGILIFTGLSHKPAVEHFISTRDGNNGNVNCEIIEMPLNVKKPLYTAMLLKKIENPEYKMTPEERKEVTAELLR